MRYKEEQSNVITTFKLTPTEKEKLKEAAATRKMSISDFIRYACE